MRVITACFLGSVVCSYSCACIHFRRLKSEHLTNDDQWKEGHAMMETHVPDRVYTYSSFATRVSQLKIWHF